MALGAVHTVAQRDPHPHHLEGSAPDLRARDLREVVSGDHLERDGVARLDQVAAEPRPLKVPMGQLKPGLVRARLAASLLVISLILAPPYFVGCPMGPRRRPCCLRGRSQRL